MNHILDFSVFSQGEETAIIPMHLLESIVKSLPRDRSFKLDLTSKINKAGDAIALEQVLTNALMLVKLQILFGEDTENIKVIKALDEIYPE